MNLIKSILYFLFFSIIISGNLSAELITLSDNELKCVRGIEGIIFPIDLPNIISLKNMSTYEIEYQKNIDDFNYEAQHQYQEWYQEILYDVNSGQIQILDSKLDSKTRIVSFDILFDNYETEDLKNTDSIGFNKQYLNQVTVINCLINIAIIP